MKKLVFGGISRDTENKILAQLESEGIIGTCDSDMNILISDEDAEKIEATWGNIDFQIKDV